MGRGQAGIRLHPSVLMAYHAWEAILRWGAVPLAPLPAISFLVLGEIGAFAEPAMH